MEKSDHPTMNRATPLRASFSIFIASSFSSAYAELTIET